MRPSDLAREHGLSAQAVRNYEQSGFIPPAARTPSGYRVYTEVHAAALRTFIALIPAFGHAVAGQIMNSVHADAVDDVLLTIDPASDIAPIVVRQHSLDPPAIDAKVRIDVIGNGVVLR